LQKGNGTSAERQAIQRPSLYAHRSVTQRWWGTKGVKGAHGESWGASPPWVWDQNPSGVHGQSHRSAGQGGGQNLAMAVLHYGEPLLRWADTHASADELVSLETAEHNIMHNFMVVQWRLSSAKNDHFYKMCVFVSISMFQGTFFHLSGFYE